LCALFSSCVGAYQHLRSFPTRRSSDLSKRTGSTITLRGLALSRPDSIWTESAGTSSIWISRPWAAHWPIRPCPNSSVRDEGSARSEEHTSELQSRENLVCRLLLEKKKL